MHEYTAVVSCKADKAKAALEKHFDVISLPCDSSLDEPVSSHPDMILFASGDSVIVPAEYYHQNKDLIEDLCSRCSLELILSSAERRREYPFDVSLNVLICGRKAFSLMEFTASEVKNVLVKHEMILNNVKQGYAACSTLSAGNAIVTSDPSVIKAATAADIDVLRIEGGNIILEGYDEGFVGGASGVCENNVYFLGNIDNHPDGEKIRSFLRNRGFECVSLWDGELTDFGGIKFFRNIR